MRIAAIPLEDDLRPLLRLQCFCELELQRQHSLQSVPIAPTFLERGKYHPQALIGLKKEGIKVKKKVLFFPFLGAEIRRTDFPTFSSCSNSCSSPRTDGSSGGCSPAGRRDSRSSFFILSSCEPERTMIRRSSRSWRRNMKLDQEGSQRGAPIPPGAGDRGRP